MKIEVRCFFLLYFYLFQAQALEATSSANCVCLFLDEACNWARALDSVPADERGPLHGLPISVKESFVVKGYDNTGGLSCFMEKPG